MVITFESGNFRFVLDTDSFMLTICRVGDSFCMHRFRVGTDPLIRSILENDQSALNIEFNDGGILLKIVAPQRKGGNFAPICPVHDIMSDVSSAETVSGEKVDQPRCNCHDKASPPTPPKQGWSLGKDSAYKVSFPDASIGFKGNRICTIGVFSVSYSS